MKLLFGLVLVGQVAVANLSAGERLVWPRFHGPNGAGIAEAQKPPVEFGPGKNLMWKVAVPSGLSSPIAAGNKLVITAFEGGSLYTIAYDRSTGKEAWRAAAPVKKLEAFHKTEGSPAASTAATDGDRIVSYFGSCGLLAYDLAGKELWKSGDQIYQERVAAAGTYYASPVAANGHLYFVALADGAVTVLEAGAEKPKAVASTKLGERTSATPAIADDTLYVRTDKHLYAFAKKK